MFFVHETTISRSGCQKDFSFSMKLTRLLLEVPTDFYFTPKFMTFHPVNKTATIWHQLSMRKNIAKILICQSFPYQIFLLAIAHVVPANFINILLIFSHYQFINISLIRNLHHTSSDVLILWLTLR